MGWFQIKTLKLQRCGPQDPSRHGMNRLGRPRSETCGEEGKGERRGAITKPRLSDHDRDVTSLRAVAAPATHHSRSAGPGGARGPREEVSAQVGLHRPGWLPGIAHKVPEASQGHLCSLFLASIAINPLPFRFRLYFLISNYLTVKIISFL